MRASRFGLACAALLCAAGLLYEASPASGADDPLKVLLDRGSCQEWREVSRLASGRLRARNSGADPNIDLKAIELSVAFLDICANDLDRRLRALGTTVVATGLGEDQSAGRRRAQPLAALIGYYKEALPSTMPASSLKTWHALVEAIDPARAELHDIIDQQFGKGAFTQYFAIRAKEPQSRTPEEQKQLATLKPWMDPL
jgi:hypothetical protein